ncbi:cytochrome c oxidase subunit NDUFA4 isoform X2 [Talpa occidentalis]|uniref:cytochrome c oxidase subunit NDUFA4 isoform X2 n=1 Tax=Talpa occidentalis TaxID=50954 RepID=UPI0023F8DC07|nr:cytochrome c oxidase subunit NDUFA4 isoform X2 [Talpa occidentalis]
MLRQIFNQARKHPSLIPLFVFIGAGGTGAALYVMRLALFNPDVSWDRKNNPEPWNKLGPNDQYKEEEWENGVEITNEEQEGQLHQEGLWVWLCFIITLNGD